MRIVPPFIPVRSISLNPSSDVKHQSCLEKWLLTVTNIRRVGFTPAITYLHKAIIKGTRAERSASAGGQGRQVSGFVIRFVSFVVGLDSASQAKRFVSSRHPSIITHLDNAKLIIAGATIGELRTG